MSRDYAKSQHKEHKPIPGWSWMLAGLAIGLFVALLVYIKDNSSGKLAITETVSKVFQPQKQTDTREVKKSVSEKPPELTSNKPKFDFYTILPELEVAIPEHELLKTPDTSSEKETNQQYMLQAGSFKKFEEAEELTKSPFKRLKGLVSKKKPEPQPEPVPAEPPASTRRCDRPGRRFRAVSSTSEWAGTSRRSPSGARGRRSRARARGRDRRP